MTDPRTLLPRAAQACTSVIERIPTEGWDSPSPCEGWSVRDVVNHLTAEHLWAPRLLAGETIEEVGDAYDGDVLGDQPLTAWRRAIDASMGAWAGADLDREIEMSSGPESGHEYANQMLIDLTVHAWDIAIGAGIEAELDPEAVAAALAYEQPRVESGGVEGIFASPVETTSNDPLDKLVALTGRDPGSRGR